MKVAFTLLGGLIFFILFVTIFNIITEPILLDFDNLVEAFLSSRTLGAVWTSLYASFLAVVVGFGLGVPLAYLLAEEDFWGKSFVKGVIDLPMAIPHTVAGIALLAVFGSSGLIGGLSGSPQFERSVLGIVTAMSFISVPYMINSAREGFQSINPRLANVSKNLGASNWETFKRVMFPLALPHIFNGAVMCWARSISEFSAVVLFVGYYPTIAPGLIWTEFHSEGLAQAKVIAVVLLLIVLPIFMILRHLRGRLFDRY
ncbi:hypothetical protein AKJ65_04355 [candidate division MSBL1 archaeon SCGC-AAA259E19]|uniref:ABC transmembrane type-1 domain-containing protein n=1 Tax=candidate division MSBL1 archaeon SCGC-AAA259E19 TaxID=1698264 RepID=A0A133UJR3_9EURY|nr:hypothetical protein AKJ65_04355 [candidate division MSBL1 archaeon SCGC-AAA259E19]